MIYVQAMRYESVGVNKMLKSQKYKTTPYWCVSYGSDAEAPELKHNTAREHS